VLSRGGNLYTRLAIGVPLRDATGGYRAFRRETLEGIGLNDVASAGYCFQVDLAWRALRKGFRVVEVPITFVERERGQSKMSRAIVAEAMLRVGRWGLSYRANQARGLLRRNG
jgi:dolichol-phosphate mannosyltransferase